MYNRLQKEKGATMTLQPQPSPYRCETCKVPKNVTKPVWCLVAGKWIYPGIPEYDLSEKYGLCCHSLVKSGSGAGAVLDELEKKIDELHYAWVSVDALKRVIAELRQTKEH